MSTDSNEDTPDRSAPMSSKAPTTSEVAPRTSATDRFRQEAAAKRQAGLDHDESEEKLWAGSYNSKAMVGTWLTITIASIALIVAAILIDGFSFGIAVGLIVVLWVIACLLYAYRRLGYHYELTTQRFIHQTGVVSRKTDRIEVIDIDDVSISQGPVQRMFGIGNIELTSSDRSHPTLSMIGIADAKNVAGLIDDTRRRERRRRSLHIEAI